MTLGETLRKHRTEKNLSLRDVESACGISNAYLSHLENDKVRKPSPFFLQKLAKLYEANYDELMMAANYVTTAITMVRCEVCGHYQRVIESKEGV